MWFSGSRRRRAWGSMRRARQPTRIYGLPRGWFHGPRYFFSFVSRPSFLSFFGFLTSFFIPFLPGMAATLLSPGVRREGEEGSHSRRRDRHAHIRSIRTGYERRNTGRGSLA